MSEDPRMLQSVLNPAYRRLDVWLRDVDGSVVRQVNFDFGASKGDLPKSWWKAVTMESDLQSGARNVMKAVVLG